MRYVMRKNFLIASFLLGLLLVEQSENAYAIPITSAEPFSVEFSNLVMTTTPAGCPQGCGSMEGFINFFPVAVPGTVQLDLFDQLTNPPLVSGLPQSLFPGQTGTGIGFQSISLDPSFSGFMKITVGGLGEIDLISATFNVKNTNVSPFLFSQTINFPNTHPIGTPEPDMLWPTLAGMVGIAFVAEARRRQGMRTPFATLFQLVN